MSSPVRLAAIAALVLAVFLAAGCGGTAFDDEKTEVEVQRYLETSLQENVRSVDCPSGEPVDAGTTFDCAVELVGGKQMIATIEIQNEDADYGIAKYAPKK